MGNRHGIIRSVQYCFLLALVPVVSQAARARAADQVKIASGTLQGTTVAGANVRAFLGIPFAAPPVGNLRWRPPQPVLPWRGVRQAVAFGPRCMQRNVYSDMVFRDKGPSEDCLYLNVWIPAHSASQRLPVMFWIYGGGFQAGATSEPRQEGMNLAKKGVVVVSANYRLGIFGFFAHPALAQESPHHAAGNYGLMDQVAALRWVKENISAFGGDPNNVTIFGESAGSWSVSQLMASPLAKGLFQKAIGESGASFGAGPNLHSAQTLPQSEKAGEKFAQSIGADSLATLRAIPADKLLQESAKGHFWPNVDGYFLPQSVDTIFAEGRQSHVPLLAGWNKDENMGNVYSKKTPPTAENLIKAVKERFGPDAEEALKFYPHSTAAEARQSTEKLASDFFTVYVTWKWLEMQNQTGDSPVYRYLFTRTPPEPLSNTDDGVPLVKLGARHSAEIPYVFGVITWEKALWQPVDFKISDAMMTYWSNFARTGNPNGEGLPRWPQYTPQNRQVMILGKDIHARPATDQKRFEFIDSVVARYRKQ
ncbi:MAG TPA: carboxylesterase/lipase family protein [Terriglobia bacterium]|nr:carboxylesterase/lipase family protein [Terriglobia bacterium]